MTYNAPFFSLFENIFKLLKNEFSEEKALDMFSRLMQQGLSKSYGNDFIKGEPSEFVRVVQERDNLVGLRVKFPIVEKRELVYQFLDDPFPNLKGFVKESKLDSCFINFKIHYLLGEQWSYKNTKHLWRGDALTEFRIFKQ